MGQLADKSPAATPKEKTLLAAVNASPNGSRAIRGSPRAIRIWPTSILPQGRYVEAEKLYSKRLELAEDSLGRANPELIPAVNDLARVNFAQMKFARAEELYERSLRIMEREYGDNDPKLIPFVEAVAQAYESDSRYPGSGKTFAARRCHSRTHRRRR